MSSVNRNISYRGHEFTLKDLTAIHPEYGGNKWFKLKYNLERAAKEGAPTVLTFGGYWSNHLYATAAACADKGFNAVGVIRGEPPKYFSDTLKFAQSKGMQLHFVSRSQYKNRHEPKFLEELKQQFGPFYLVPQGGSNALGVRGCREILQDNEEFDLVFCACGNGATLAGIVLSLKPHQRALGVAAMRGDFMKRDVMQHLSDYLQSEEEAANYAPRFEVIYDCHFGGFAKACPELLDFIRDFKSQTGVQLDPVYTGKMMWAALRHLDKSKEKPRILTIHTGGLQGIRGFGL